MSCISVPTATPASLAPRGPKASVSATLPSRPGGLKYRRTAPVWVSVTVKVYSTLVIPARNTQYR